MAFSPDSKILATAADREVPKLWDVAMGKELQLDKSNAVRFSPDGKTFSMRKGAFDTPMSRPPAISPEGHWLLRIHFEPHASVFGAEIRRAVCPRRAAAMAAPYLQFFRRT